MANTSMAVRKLVVTGPDGVRKEIARDDAAMVRALIDATDYGRKYRSMRRSMDRLGDALMDVQVSQAKSEDASAFVSITPEQLEHLHEVAKDPPTEGQNATIRIIGGPMRKALNLIEDTYDEWKKGLDGKPERLEAKSEVPLLETKTPGAEA